MPGGTGGCYSLAFFLLSLHLLLLNCELLKYKLENKTGLNRKRNRSKGRWPVIHLSSCGCSWVSGSLSFSLLLSSLSFFFRFAIHKLAIWLFDVKCFALAKGFINISYGNWRWRDAVNCKSKGIGNKERERSWKFRHLKGKWFWIKQIAVSAFVSFLCISQERKLCKWVKSARCHG